MDRMKESANLMNQAPAGVEKYPLFLVYVWRFGRYFFQPEWLWRERT